MTDSEAGGAGSAWHDDPNKDYRKRYYLPEHWVMTDDTPFSVDYRGYIQAVLSLVPESGHGLRALDAGCGDGFLSKKLVERGFAVTGVDYSERAVAFGKMFVPEAELHCVDLRDLNQRAEWKGQFDLVISVEVLEHIPVENQLHVCQSLAWALKESGALVISVPSTDMRGSYTHYKHFGLDEIHHLLGEAQLEVQSTLHQNRLSPLLSRRLWKLLKNKTFDMVAARRALAKMWLRSYNIARPGQKVGRFIMVCRKKSSSKLSSGAAGDG